MQLFRNDWLTTARHAFHSSGTRLAMFGARYGVVLQQAASRPFTPPVREDERSLIEHERAVLRYLAQQDRAA